MRILSFVRFVGAFSYRDFKKPKKLKEGNLGYPRLLCLFQINAFIELVLWILIGGCPETSWAYKDSPEAEDGSGKLKNQNKTNNRACLSPFLEKLIRTRACYGIIFHP